LSAQFSHLAFILVFFVAKLFSFRHKDTKTLRTNNKIKSFVPARHRLRLRRGGQVFVPWWQIFLGSLRAVGLRAVGRLVQIRLY